MIIGINHIIIFVNDFHINKNEVIDRKTVYFQMFYIKL